VILIWLFVIGLVVLAGIEINAQLGRMAEHKDTEITVGPNEDS
jgi:uncharacterized BrkB/YihY/UPF0761 family membrane protein